MPLPYRKLNPFVLSLFFLSGLCGLIYEIIWIRLLRLVMGNTVFSVSTVLTAFMGGLALGSYVAGRLIDRRGHPLKIYGILEGLIGLYCIAIPGIIAATQPLYRFLYQDVQTSFLLFSFLRFLICSGILLVPTTLMGATLPVLSKYFVRQADQLGWTIGKLYAINTFGAVIGAAGTGFALIPTLGVQRTLYAAVAINLAIALSVLLMVRRTSAPAASEQPPRPIPQEPRTSNLEPRTSVAFSIPPGLLLLSFGLAGFASMVYEVAWTRVLTLVIGSSVYAFSLMLTAFISGIGLGSIVFSRWIDRRRNLLFGFALIEIVIGLSALLFVPILGKLPLFFVHIIVRYSSYFGLLHLIEFGLILLLMLPPTTMMGVAFPLISKIYTRHLEQIGHSIGNVYSANTLGAILGSFMGGFILVPWLGIQQTIFVAVTVNLLLGIAFLLGNRLVLFWKRGAAAAILLVVVLFTAYVIPPWDQMLLTSAPYLYAYKYEKRATGQRESIAKAMKERRKILYHKEGVTTTVTVTQAGDEIFLKVNGKTDASSKKDLRTQSLLSHLPLLLHSNPRDVLLIGLGSGISLGAAEQHRNVESIECVEISPEVVEASHFFDHVNHRAGQDPRARIIVEDGRNHIALTSKQYDVIISQPSNLWISGMADLFTVEFFTLCRKHLRKGGLMGQWVQAYLMSRRDFQSVIRTFASVFPHVSLWESHAGEDYFLIGSVSEAPLSVRALEQRMIEEDVRRDLARINVLDAPTLLSCMVTAGPNVLQFTDEAPIHTDDNALLEFAAPKSMYRILYGSPEAYTLSDIAPYRTGPVPFLIDPGPAEINRIRRAYQARTRALSGRVYEAQHNTDQAIAEYQKALSLNPMDLEAVHRLPPLYFSQGYAYMRHNQNDLAIAAYRKGLAIQSDNANAYRNLGLLYERTGKIVQAELAYTRAVDLFPGFVEAWNNLGLLYIQERQYDKAIAAYQRAIQADRDYAIAHENLANAYLLTDQTDRAIAQYQQALRLNPDLIAAYTNLGTAYIKKGLYNKAKTAFQAALKRDPDNANIAQKLNQLRAMGY